MNEPIEESYFIWLYNKVASVENPSPSLTYWTLLRDLHSTEFVWLIPGDDNRAKDGLDVRKEFLRQMGLSYNEPMMSLGCSVLEMFIAFSRRTEFQTDISARDWFWMFLDNLKLFDLNDAADDITVIVTEVMDEFIWRTYRRNGRGGMFPMKRRSENDQRKVEIWYQFCEWLVDQNLI